jgi:uncharacterized protein DUF2786
MNVDRDKMVIKIQKLLALAESTSNEAEAATFLEKAQALQESYLIEQHELIRDGRAKAEEIGYVVTLEGKSTPLIKAKRELIWGLADLNRCQSTMAHDRSYVRIYGFDSDREMVLAMFNSIMIQLQTAMASAERTEYGPLSGTLKSWRVSFAHGYVRRVLSRLTDAQARRNADAARVATPGAELVLVNRAQLVKNYLDSNVKTKKNSGYRTDATSNREGYWSGDRHGTSADLGGARVGGVGHQAVGS